MFRHGDLSQHIIKYVENSCEIVKLHFSLRLTQAESKN